MSIWTASKAGAGAWSVVARRIGAGRRAAIIALVGLVATAGIASATIPSGNVVDACYTNGGFLRVIDADVTACGKNETSLAWNVQGPQGEKGDVGETGPQGPAGPAGTSVLANVTSVSSYTFVPNGINYEQILTKNLPEGTYAFIATVHMNSTYTDVRRFACELRDGGTVLGGAASAYAFLEGGNLRTGTETLTLNGMAEVPALGTDISIWCVNSGSAEGTMSGAQLLILKIGGSF